MMKSNSELILKMMKQGVQTHCVNDKKLKAIIKNPSPKDYGMCLQKKHKKRKGNNK